MGIFPQVFLPDYIPDISKILPRGRQSESFQSLILDLFEDDEVFLMNIYGSKGMGKRTFSFGNIYELKSCKIEFSDIIPLHIDGRYEEAINLVYGAIKFINSREIVSIKIFDKLPALIYFYSNRENNQNLRPLFILNNIEKIKLEQRLKLLKSLKKQQMNAICTMNSQSGSYSSELFGAFTDIMQLKELNYYELFKISKFVREDSSFNELWDNDLKFLTLLLCTHNLRQPGKIVELLKGYYRVIKIDTLLDYNFSRFLGNNLGITFQYSESELLNIYDNSPPIEKEILNGLLDEYKSSKRNYIYSDDLVILYDSACDNLDKSRRRSEFAEILLDLEKKYILLSENHFLRDHYGNLSKIPYENDILFFLVDLNNFERLIRNNSNRHKEQERWDYSSLYS